MSDTPAHADRPPDHRGRAASRRRPHAGRRPRPGRDRPRPSELRRRHALTGIACFIASADRDGLAVRLVVPEHPDVRRLGQNVVEHAGSPVGGFVAAQRYKSGAPDERIIVAVGDVGVGIRESLRPRYGDMTDAKAITQAIRWNVSRVPEDGRGQGLPGVVEGVRGLEGILWIRSGSALRTITRQRAATTGVSRLQATIVGARLPCRPGR